MQSKKTIKSLLLTGMMIPLSLAGLIAPRAAAAEVDPERVITFSWGGSEDVKAYQLEFSRQEDDKYSVIPDGLKTLEKPAFEGKLPPGHYHIRIRALDQRSVPGAWGEPINLAVPYGPVTLLAPAADKKLKSDSPSSGPVTFTWRPLRGAPAYLVKVTGAKQKVVLEKEVTEPTLQAELPVAQDYSWEVKVKSGPEEFGEAGSIRVFTLTGPRLATPEPQVDVVGGQHVLSWPKPEYAETFDVKLLYRKSKKAKWEVLSKVEAGTKTNLEVPGDNPGAYRLQVTAKANKRQNSLVGKLSFKIDKETANQDSTPAEHPDLRLSAAFTPTYWRHGTAADDNSGVSFTILMFEGFALDAETWFLARDFSAELIYTDKITTLFAGNVAGSGTEAGQQPLQLNEQDVAIRLKYNYHLLSFADLSGIAGIRRSTALFFYKSSPSTIAVFNSDATYLTISAGLNLWLWKSGELRGWAETDYPLNGQGFTIEHATDYRLNANLTSYLSGHTVSLLFLYEYDYKHWLYNLSSLNITGHVTDTMHTVGAGLEVQF